MRTTPEKKLQNKIIAFLTKLSYTTGGSLLFQRRDSATSNYIIGSADLWCLYKSIHVEIEVKAPGGKRSPLQEKWENICKLCGAAYILTDSYDNFIEQWNNIFNCGE